MTAGMKTSEFYVTLVSMFLMFFGDKTGLTASAIEAAGDQIAPIVSSGNWMAVAVAGGLYAIARGIGKLKG